MLKFQSVLASHLQASRQCFHILHQKPLVSLMITFVIAITLALPAFFGVLTYNLGQWTSGWQHGGHISLYLKPITPSSQSALLEKVRETQGVGQAMLKSPEDGLAELIKQEGMHDIMRYLPNNPLPPVIEIVPALIIDSPNQLSALAKKLQLFPEVEQVKLDMKWVTRLHALFNVAEKVVHGLMLLLAIAVVLIISTTLRFAIHSRFEEIEVLKLIGASPAFIIRPYLYLGLWYALSGSFLAVFLVDILTYISETLINQWALVYQIHFSMAGLSIRQILPLIAFAVILSKLGLSLSVKRQLLNIEA